MHRGEHPEIMWGLGLDPDTAALIEQSAGPGFALRNLPPDALPWMRGQEGGGQAAWIPLDVWRGLSKIRRKACRDADSVRRILIVPEDAESLEIDEVLAEGFLTAVRAPLTRYKVRDAVLRLRELDSLAADLRRRTDEVMLERELLARKSSHLSFLNRVLSRASASLDVGTILSKVRGDLRHLLPVEALCAVFWTRIEGGAGLDAEMYLHCRMAPPELAAWEQMLRGGAERLAGVRVREYRQFCLTGGRHMVKAPAPDSGRLLMLPLAAGGESFGCLALLTGKGLRLAKDQVETLNAAVNHLALALRNALLYRQVKSMADHDGLTAIANRRRFEERLEEEARRHGRYELPLSLILVDIDHFKGINDTHGHQTGDAVLRAVAALLVESLRATDFPARYGGEEFAVILPHTTGEQALLLAERIREGVSRREFGEGDLRLRLTVSAGVSSLAPGAGGRDLVSLADQALYLAKNGGRNRVVVAAPAEGAEALGCGGEQARAAGLKAAPRVEPLRAGGGL